MDDVRRVTDPPGHHFFGYYEKSPWNADESRLLAHETEFQNRRPTAEDAAGICLIDTASGELERVAETHAWDFQQGAMLQWLGPGYERRFVFNDRAGADEPREGFVARIHDVETGRVRTVDRPVYAVAPDGETAYTLDFDRLDHTRPGYGYAPLDGDGEGGTPAPHPADEGVYRVDLGDGGAELLVSLDDLAGFDPEPSMDHGTHWVNHVQRSPSGARIAFIHRSETPDDRRWLDRLFAMDADGTALECLHSGFVSHYDWRTDDELLAWTDHDGEAFFRYDVGGDAPARPVGRDVLPRDGHCSFSPDGEWLLLDDTGWGGGRGTARQQGVYVYHWETGELIELCRVQCPPVRDNSLRCDLHPRWDREGAEACFDSTHERSRQLYVVDVPSDG